MSFFIAFFRSDPAIDVCRFCHPSCGGRHHFCADNADVLSDMRAVLSYAYAISSVLRASEPLPSLWVRRAVAGEMAAPPLHQYFCVAQQTPRGESTSLSTPLFQLHFKVWQPLH